MGFIFTKSCKYYYQKIDEGDLYKSKTIGLGRDSINTEEGVSKINVLMILDQTSIEQDNPTFYYL